MLTGIGFLGQNLGHQEETHGPTNMFRLLSFYRNKWDAITHLYPNLKLCFSYAVVEARDE